MLSRLFSKEKENKKKLCLSIRDITLIGMMIAVIEAGKMALAFLPNVELTTFWIIMFTLLFGWKIIYVILIFILIEAVIYPFGPWVIMYLYAWPLLAFIVKLFHKIDSVWFWSVLSGMYGLSFGLLCSFTYIFINSVGTNLSNGFAAAFAWWLAGIPMDILHGVANYILMLMLYAPIRSIIESMHKIYN